MDGEPHGRQLEVPLMDCSPFTLAHSKEPTKVGMTASLQAKRIGTALGPNGWAECRMRAADGSTLENKRHLAGPPGDFLGLSR